MASVPMIALVGATLLDGRGSSPLASGVLLVDGERITAVGRFIERTGGADDPTFMPLAWTRAGEYYGPRLADGADDCRRAVREQLRDGADWIKTCSTGAAFNHPGSRTDVSEWTMEELRAI